MTVIGYSDRINHALAFVAKHQDRQVHTGAGLPYRTKAANVAIILTRYGQDDDTVVAGILREVIADCVRNRFTRLMLEQRIADKFGIVSLEIALSITPRLADELDIEFSHEERRDDVLERLGSADVRARWVCAADALHDACSTLADVRRTIDPNTVWSRFALGREGTLRWLRRLSDRLVALDFDEPIISELSHAIGELGERSPTESAAHDLF